MATFNYTAAPKDSKLIETLKKTTKDEKLVKRKADFLDPLLSTKSKRKAFIQKLG